MLLLRDVFGLLLTSTAVAALIVLGGGYLVRQFFTRLLDRDLENFKAKLANEGELEAVKQRAVNDRELERFRGELQTAALEHQVRFTNLHGKQAETIAEVYRKLAVADRNFVSLIKPFQAVGELTREEKMRVAVNAGNDFITYFDEHRVFLPSGLCERIDKLNDGMMDVFITFQVYVAVPSGQQPKESTDKWIEAWDKLKDELPLVRRDIEAIMRSLLGLPNSG